MPIVNRIAAFDEDMKKWRRSIHQNPELGLDCYETASFIEARLREFGIDEIHTGIAKCRCPYCDEPIQLVIDPMQIDSQYEEDCEVCCRPMLVTPLSSTEALCEMEG